MFEESNCGLNISVTKNYLVIVIVYTKYVNRRITNKAAVNTDLFE